MLGLQVHAGTAGVCWDCRCMRIMGLHMYAGITGACWDCRSMLLPPASVRKESIMKVEAETLTLAYEGLEKQFRTEEDTRSVPAPTSGGGVTPAPGDWTLSWPSWVPTHTQVPTKINGFWKD